MTLDWLAPPSRHVPYDHLAVTVSRGAYGDLQCGVYINGAHVRPTPLNLRVRHHLAGSHWIVPPIDAKTTTDAIVLLERILDRYEAGGLPWGIASRGTHFAEDGSIQWGPGCTGLTCATFIVTFLRSVGVELVDDTTWPVPSEDLQADRRKRIERMAADPARRAALEAELHDAKIILPEEVVAACACPMPASYDEVGPRAADVWQALMGTK